MGRLRIVTGGAGRKEKKLVIIFLPGRVIFQEKAIVLRQRQSGSMPRVGGYLVDVFRGVMRLATAGQIIGAVHRVRTM